MRGQTRLRRTVLALALAAVTATLAAAADARAPAPPTRRVVVELRVPATARTLSARAAAVHAVQERVLERLAGLGFRVTARWEVTPGLAGIASAAAVAALRRDPAVAAVGRDPGGRAHLAESVPLIRADAVQARGFTGAGVTVATVDSGIDTDHADLARDVAGQRCFATRETGASACPNGSARAEDDNGHGTAVAGVITSDGVQAPPGVAPGARVVAVKVLDRNGRFYSADTVISAIDWLAANRPDVRVVNMSIGTDALYAGVCDEAETYLRLAARALQPLRARGTLLFASAGNEAAASKLSAPACLRGVVAVGATYDANIGPTSFSDCHDLQTATDKMVCFSNGGAALDLLAPGGAITTSGRGGGSVTAFGTSFSSPHAAGAAALLLQAHPEWTAAQVTRRLVGTGPVVRDARTGLTYHRLDVLAALDAPAAPPLPFCRVPAVVGRALASARSSVARARCVVGSVTRRFGPKRAGVVAAQQPRAGAHAELGTAVRLVVSRGPRR